MIPTVRASKIKLCLVIPSLQAGGMERVMSELAHYFSSNTSLELNFVLYGKEPEIFYKVPKDVIVTKPYEKFNDKSRLFSTLTRLLFLRKTVRDINPDSILSFGEYWNSFVLLALYGLKYPVYISDRCSPEKKYGVFHRFLRKFFYPQATGIIAQTNAAKLSLTRQIVHKNIEVIGNPVTNIFSHNSFNHQGKIILSVGRLIETKHYDRLIRIFSRVKAPEWKLVIIGSNALKQDIMTRLVTLVKELDLGNSVILEGKKSDVFDYYCKSKLFAFTSSSEGFPNVVGEALSAGLPVISYDCVAGPSELISDGNNGFLVPVFDDELFLERLQLLIDNDNLRSEMSRKAVESVSRFRIESIGKQYLDFIISAQR